MAQHFICGQGIFVLKEAGKLGVSGCGIPLVLALCLALSGCGASGGGDEVIVGGGSSGGGTDPGDGGDPDNGGGPTKPVCQTYVVDKDAPGASDNNDGRYAGDGGSGPWRTIQHAVDRVGPCDTIQVRRSATPYSEDTAGYAVMIVQGGETNKPITLEGFPGERPILDLRQDGSGNAAVSGILLNCISWFTLRNFEIRNVAEAGITSSLTGCRSHDLVIEDMVIHDVYGGNMVAAIRLAGASNALIRNNVLYDIFKIRDDNGPVVLPSISGSSNIEIAANSISGAGAGLVASMQSAQKLAVAMLHHNRIHDVAEGVVFQAGAAGGAFSEVEIYGNFLYSLERVLRTDTGSSAVHSTELSFRNNTVANVTGVAIELDKVAGISTYNNIFSNVGKEYLIGGDSASFDYVDNNLYWPLNAAGWVLFTAGVPRSYTTFDEWKTSYASEGAAALHADPDVLSLVIDPLLTDAEQHNYELAPNSPARNAGRSGLSMGSDFDSQPVGASIR